MVRKSGVGAGHASGSWCQGGERVITCRPPMRCARRRTIDYDRTTPVPKDEKVAPALSAGEETPATQMEFHKLTLLLRAYEPTTSRSSTTLSQMDFFHV